MHFKMHYKVVSVMQKWGGGRVVVRDRRDGVWNCQEGPGENSLR